MRLRVIFVGTWVLAWAGLTASSHVEAEVVKAAVTFNSPLASNGSTFDDSQIIGITAGGSSIALLAALTELLPPEADIDAFDFVSDNRLYFSLDAPASIGGATFQDEDVLLWNGSVVSLAWSGAANGLPPEADLDALSIITESPLSFSFSLDAPANLVFTGGAAVVSDSDVIRFTAGTGFEGFEFTGGPAGLPSEADVDAINRPGDGRMAFSFSVPVMLAGVAGLVDDGDAVAWNFGAGVFQEVLFKAADAALPGEADLNGLELNSTQLNPYDGRPFGDFDNDHCTDIADFLFLLENWMMVSSIGGAEIGILDFLALLENWNTGPGCS